MEHYPIPGQPAPPWAPERRRWYLAELNRLFLAGKISQHELDRTLAERAEAVREHSLTQAEESPRTPREPAAGAIPSSFPSYLDGRLDRTGEPTAGWQ